MFKSEIVREIKLLSKVANKKCFKPLWVVSELQKRYGQNYVLSSNVLNSLSRELRIDKGKIKWFVKEVLANNSEIRNLRST